MKEQEIAYNFRTSHQSLHIIVCGATVVPPLLLLPLSASTNVDKDINHIIGREQHLIIVCCIM